MKIYMARRDEVLRRKQAYQDQQQQHELEYTYYSMDKQEKLDAVAAIVKSEIGDTTLDISVKADSVVYGFIRVTVDNGSSPSQGNQALTWSWSVTFDSDGEIKKDSGSWSGLQAVTNEQLENLKESVRVLEILNSLDWKTILDVELPRYNDYVVTRYPNYEDFDKQLKIADIEDAIDEGKLLKGVGYRYYRSTVYYNVVSETDKSYKVQEIHEGNVSDPNTWPDPYTVRKNVFYQLIASPVETM